MFIPITFHQRDQARALPAQGIDPGQARKLARQKRRELAANSFQAIAQEWKAHHLDGLREGSEVMSIARRRIWAGK